MDGGLDRIDAFYNLEPDRQIVDNDKSGGTDAEGKERTQCDRTLFDYSGRYWDSLVLIVKLGELSLPVAFSLLYTSKAMKAMKRIPKTVKRAMILPSVYGYVVPPH